MTSTTGGLRTLVAAATVLTITATIGCTNRPPTGTPSPPTNGVIATPYAVPCPDGTPSGMDHSGGSSGGMNHGNGSYPARLQHDPCDAEKAAARRLVADTRAAVKRNGQDTVAALKAQGYISIGDELSGTTHYARTPYHRDPYNLDPDHIEEFAIRGGRVVAAMYILTNGMTMDNVPDIAGNWTMWHDHVLSFKSNNPNVDDYLRLGGPYIRHGAPMLHVWLEKNPCGPFTGTDAAGMTGSCTQGIE